MAMIHAKKYKPRIFPIKGDASDAEIDRAQKIAPTATLNRDEVKEIGRESNDGVVGYIKRASSVAYSLTQLEYGSLEFWQKLINDDTLGNDGETPIDLDDFNNAYFNICAYLTDDDDNFVGTMWYPKLRTSGFSITVGDPDAIIERSFDLVGESAVQWQGDNKYIIYGTHTAGSGGDNEIDLTSKEPAEDPDNSGEYMLMVTRYRSGTGTTELTVSTDYSYSSVTKILTINASAIATGDVIKYWYTSATAPDAQFTVNDSDPVAIAGDSVSIYLYIPASGKPSSSDYIYKLQSATIDVSLSRTDYKELGNKAVVKRGVDDKTVTITLGRILSETTVEEVLRGAGSDYGKLDVDEFTDEATLIIKFYADNSKTSFKYGIKCTDLTVSNFNPSVDVGAYAERENVLTGSSMQITASTSELGI